jgi:hypothetical protein
MKSPFAYVAWFQFTNRKHREIEHIVRILPDADFEAYQIQVVSELPFFFQLFDDQSRPLSCEFVPSEVFRGVCGPPLIPQARYHAGSALVIRAKLPDGLDIGRKRPSGGLQIIGMKVYESVQRANAVNPQSVETAEESASL